MKEPLHSPYKSTGGLQRIWRAWRYSMQGLFAALKYESAFRQETTLVVILVPVAFWAGRDRNEVLFLLFSMLLVLVAELLNSAVEAIVDKASPEFHELAGRAKDMGSAAVLLLMLNVVVCWGLILWA